MRLQGQGKTIMNFEIGSEFYTVPIESDCGLIYPKPGLLSFCGRTAIETVLNSIKARTALLPSYCCESMIEPFQKKGMEVFFYDVNYKDQLIIDTDITDNIDVVFWCNYFGFKTEMPNFSKFLSRGGIIVEDITHSLFSTVQCNKQSQYIVASLRKWEPILSGGYCAGNNLYDNYIEPPIEFISKKQYAMDLKADYLISPDALKKEAFLSAFNESNQWLANNYSNLGIDEKSKYYLSKINMMEHRKIRRRNAEMLYDKLNGRVEFLFDKETMDCPLFVPVIIKKNRDLVRQKLIDKNIYCPIHWPKPERCESNIYDMELSLICDQRYGEEEMNRLISTLGEVL